MFNQTWKKYLPVIGILIKRSVNGEQMLQLNHTDFERASGGRKMKWGFPVMILVNGRVQNIAVKHNALAVEMLFEMQADEQINALLKKHEFEISMTNDFKLTIKNTSVSVEEEATDLVEETVATAEIIETGETIETGESVISEETVEVELTEDTQKENEPIPEL